MGILVKPTYGCNYQCDYCYESGLPTQELLDMVMLKQAIKDAYAQDRGDLVFHGGEFLLLSKAQIRELFQLAFDLKGSINIQTNGSLLDDEIIQMMVEYKASVGLSLDGPWPLNASRGCGGIDARKTQYEQVMLNIDKLIVAGICPGVITVVHNRHMGAENIGVYKTWMIGLCERGIQGSHNLIQRPSDTSGLVPTSADTLEWYKSMADVILGNARYQWQPYRNIVDALLGLGLGVCSFSRCDIYHASAAIEIKGDGSVTSCSRSLSSGKLHLRAAEYSKVRAEILAQIPREHGGCHGCRYWKICNGLCPGTALDGDWRNRSEQCDVYYGLYAHIENRLRGLMPNIKLCIDDPIDDFAERACNRQQTTAFDAMLFSVTESPSSFRCTTPRVTPFVITTPFMGAGLPAPTNTPHGDTVVNTPHGDHTDHTDYRGGGPTRATIKP